jgi:hypothetical protein
MIPAAFRSKKTLERLNIVSVGASLAAMTGVVLTSIFRDASIMPIVTALPTLVLGMLWVHLLRWDKTVTGAENSVRVGWLLSVPLAALNAALACGLMLSIDRSPYFRPDFFERFLAGMLAGGLIGAIVWIPALLATLLVFGVPLGNAQRLAKKGLAGAERGEAIVGVASAVIGALALALSLAGSFRSGAGNMWFPQMLAVLGAVFGASAFASARAREGERKKFVEAVERGEVDRFRVDTTDEGKVLVRVVSQGQGYRVADYEEAVAALDHEGGVTRGVRVATES